MTHASPVLNQIDDSASHGPHAGDEAYQPPPMARPVMASWSEVTDPSNTFAEPMMLSGLSRSACAFDLLLFGAYMVGYFVVISFLFAKGPEEEPGVDFRLVNVAVTLGGGAVSVIVVAILTRMRGLHAASLGLTWNRLPANLLLGLAMTLATFAVFYLSILGIAVLWPAGFEELKSNPHRIAQNLPRLPLVGFAGLALCVGFYEEAVFRGFLLSRLRRLTGSWALAVPLGALVFALPHVQMQAAPTAVPLFFLAVLWSVNVWWRRSLVPIIVGHFLFNFIQFVGMAYFQNPDWR